MLCCIVLFFDFMAVLAIRVTTTASLKIANIQWNVKALNNIQTNPMPYTHISIHTSMYVYTVCLLHFANVGERYLKIVKEFDGVGGSGWYC